MTQCHALYYLFKIKTMETHKRTITRALTWRVTATLLTALWTGIHGAIAINVLMIFAHYAHERIWLRVGWGK
jgi:hypothetical protein